MAHENARELIERRIKTILDEWDYEKRKIAKPDECPCYSSGKCHAISDLNCFFCFCPNYDLCVEEGGCNLGNPLGKGKWFIRQDGTKIWDCSDCEYPHKRENVEKMLRENFWKDDCDLRK